MAATTPSQVQRAVVSLQDSVSKLRNSALRFPKPFSEMLLNFAGDVERAMALSSAGQLQVALRDQVTPVCQQTISNRYPFVRGSNSDAPLADFAKLFAPGGVMDTFFKQYLDAHADRSKPQWTWRQNSELAGTLSLDTLQAFQRASEIRDAFFQTGGNVPVVQLTVKPASASDASVQLEIGGTVIASPTASAANSLPTNAPCTACLSSLRCWYNGREHRFAPRYQRRARAASHQSLSEPVRGRCFACLRRAASRCTARSPPQTLPSRGYVLRYDFTSAASRNPLNLAALRAFKCPSAI